MNETSPIAVLETRLPYLDRRALSQAWFDALHLARASEPASPSARPTVGATTASTARTRAEAGAVSAHDAAASGRGLAAPRREARTPLAEASSLPRRPPAKARVRTVERRLRPSEPPRVAGLTLAIEGARVQICVRREGGRTRIVAVCAAQHVETVQRALAGLDLALRVRGEETVSVVHARAAAC